MHNQAIFMLVLPVCISKNAGYGYKSLTQMHSAWAGLFMDPSPGHFKYLAWWFTNAPRDLDSLKKPLLKKNTSRANRDVFLQHPGS